MAGLAINWSSGSSGMSVSEIWSLMIRQEKFPIPNLLLSPPVTYWSYFLFSMYFSKGNGFLPQPTKRGVLSGGKILNLNIKTKLKKNAPCHILTTKYYAKYLRRMSNWRREADESWKRMTEYFLRFLQRTRNKLFTPPPWYKYTLDYRCHTVLDPFFGGGFPPLPFIFETKGGVELCLKRFFFGRGGRGGPFFLDGLPSGHVIYRGG